MGDFSFTLIVFGVLGYFLLRHCCHVSSLRWDALEWQQNVFESTAVGLLLFGASRMSAPWIVALVHRLDASGRAESFFNACVPSPFMGCVVLGAAIGLLGTTLVNHFWDKDR